MNPTIRLIPIITDLLLLLLRKITLNLTIHNPLIIIHPQRLLSHLVLIHLQCRLYFPYLELVAFFCFLAITTVLLPKDIITSAVHIEPELKPIFWANCLSWKADRFHILKKEQLRKNSEQAKIKKEQNNDKVYMPERGREWNNQNAEKSG